MFPLEHITPLIDYKFSRLNQASIFIKHEEAIRIDERVEDWFDFNIESNGHMSTFGERLNYDSSKFLIPLRKIDYANMMCTITGTFAINYPQGSRGEDAFRFRDIKLISYRYDTDTFAVIKNIYDRPFNIEAPDSTTSPAQERHNLSIMRCSNVGFSASYFWGFGLAFSLYPGDTLSRVTLKVEFEIE